MVFEIHQHELATRNMLPPHTESPFQLPPHPIPLGFPRALTLGALLHASHLHWSPILHMIVYMFHY